MSPNTLGLNDILTNTNYFLLEFNARMTLARKGLSDHVVTAKSEHAMLRKTAEWKAEDLKALAILVRFLGPNYQSMVRETSTALEAWETLREFFVKQNLHNRAQLRKKLHDFSMSAGGNLMDHLLEFDDLCLRLAAVGDKVDDDERLIILLGSLPHEYDAMVKIIEARDTTTLFEAKEMLRREYEALAQQDKEEAAFNVRGFRGERSRGDLNGARNQSSRRAAGNRNQRGQWRRRQNGQSHGPMNGIFQDVASDRAQAVELPS